MTRLHVWLCVSCLLAHSLAQAQTPSPPIPPLPALPLPPNARAAPVEPSIIEQKGLLELTGVPVPDALQLLYAHMQPRSFVLDPAALDDGRTITFRWRERDGPLERFADELLRALGYTRRNIGSVLVVRKVDADTDKQRFTYLPRHRSVTYLVETLAPLFTGRFSTDRGISSADHDAIAADRPAPPNTIPGHINRKADALAFHGSSEEIA
jgi:general secretion pathway protein D